MVLQFFRRKKVSASESEPAKRSTKIFVVSSNTQLPLNLRAESLRAESIKSAKSVRRESVPDHFEPPRLSRSLSAPESPRHNVVAPLVDLSENPFRRGSLLGRLSEGESYESIQATLPVPGLKAQPKKKRRQNRWRTQIAELAAPEPGPSELPSNSIQHFELASSPAGPPRLPPKRSARSLNSARFAASRKKGKSPRFGGPSSRFELYTIPGSREGLTSAGSYKASGLLDARRNNGRASDKAVATPSSKPTTPKPNVPAASSDVLFEMSGVLGADLFSPTSPILPLELPSSASQAESIPIVQPDTIPDTFSTTRSQPPSPTENLPPVYDSREATQESEGWLKSAFRRSKRYSLRKEMKVPKTESVSELPATPVRKPVDSTQPTPIPTPPEMIAGPYELPASIANSPKLGPAPAQRSPLLDASQVPQLSCSPSSSTGSDDSRLSAPPIGLPMFPSLPSPKFKDKALPPTPSTSLSLLSSSISSGDDLFSIAEEGLTEEERELRWLEVVEEHVRERKRLLKGKTKASPLNQRRAMGDFGMGGQRYGVTV